MAITVRNLNFSYGRKPFLENIDLQIQKGKFTVLLGRNGSGKSTLFKLLAGILKPGSGEMAMMGTDPARLTLRERAKIIGFLPQHHRPVFPFSVMDVVLTGRAGRILLTPKPEDFDKALDALKTIGILELKDRPFTELSGGEQQMVMIARVIAQNPKIILLDEPTAHLDYVHQASLLKLIKSLTGMGFTILAVLHDPNTAFLYGDDFIFLNHGRVFRLEPGQNPWDRQVLRKIYGINLETVPFRKRALVVPDE